MLFGKREPRSVIARRREAFRPAGENLENRLLMAIDLGAATPPNLPIVATHPYGVDLAGAQSSGGVGFSVADVGDVNGDGFDDFVIGAPTVVNTGGQVRLGVGGNSRAYLVFGSAQVNATNVDWFRLTAQQRVGDLGQLGNTANTQQNPVNGQPFGTGFNGYDGIQFLNSQTLRSQLGSSVAALGDINGDGFADFMIGAPNAPDANGANAGTGRAYLVYGGPNIGAAPNKTVDFDNTLSSGLVKFITFTNSNANASTGRSVAGVGDVFGDGRNDLAIGAPTASLGGVTSGAVYLVGGSAIPGTPTITTINLSTVGQPAGTRGVIFTGAQSGDLAGFSVAGAGNVDSATGAGGIAIQDLLIGAPNANNGTGAAYLVYGGTNLLTLPNTTSGPSVISLARLGTPTATPATPPVVPGAIFTGTAVGDLTGFSVSRAGDFNNDGLADFLIGSPGFQNFTGLASLIYGQSINATPLTGTIPLAAIPSPFTSASFVGAGAGALAGYSLSESGRINLDAINEILIGSPGLNNENGGVYLVPGNPNLNGIFGLNSAESQPVAATLLTASNSPSGTPAFFGAAVSGRLLGPNQRRTIDGDSIADFIVGAPGYGVVPGRGLDGGVFVLEGRFIPLQTPINTQLQVTIGVDSPTAPFVVNATAPDTLRIFVFSNATTNPTFDPVRDINPKTLVVNGVPFPNATITADPVDENGDGIPDAIITITPRSSLNLTSSTTTFTISGSTLASSPNANKKFTGSAAIQVTGGGGGGGGGGGSALPVGFTFPKTFVPPFGPDRYVPQLASLSRLDYKAIPLSVAYLQYLPSNAYRQRTINFFKPAHEVKPFGSKYSDTGRGISTLGRDVFTRGKFHAGKHFTFTHKGHVIPRNRQTEHY